MKNTIRLLLALGLTFSLCGLDAAAGPPPSKKKTPCVQGLAQCPDQGCGGDPLLNRAKNRTDPAQSQNPEEWTIGEITAINEDSPTSWSKNKPRDELRDLGESEAVIVKGFVIHHKQEGQESCNCFLTEPESNDIHINLLAWKGSKADKEESLVAEITPRARKPGWSIEKIRNLTKKKRYVRVTGWLMFDSQHASPGQTSRATSWEVHPVTQFEVCTATKAKCDSGTGWKKLEDL